MKSTKTSRGMKMNKLRRQRMLQRKGNDNPLWSTIMMIVFIVIISLMPLCQLIIDRYANFMGTGEAYAAEVPYEVPYVVEVHASSQSSDPQPYSTSSSSSRSEIVIQNTTDFISEPEPEILPTAQEIAEMCMGDAVISTDLGTLTRYSLPDIFYPGLDFSSFQGYMSWRMITDTSTEAYKVISDDRLYIDENGMCRFETTDDQFTIDGQDDYVIALGTYYKEKGTCGSRWLVVTTTGAYTAITGDEKANKDTDPHNMFVFRRDGTSTGIIEWIVDYKLLNEDIALHGTVTQGPIEAAQGEILYMYRIE